MTTWSPDTVSSLEVEMASQYIEHFSGRIFIELNGLALLARQIPCFAAVAIKLNKTVAVMIEYRVGGLRLSMNRISVHAEQLKTC